MATNTSSSKKAKIIFSIILACIIILLIVLIILHAIDNNSLKKLAGNVAKDEKVQSLKEVTDQTSEKVDELNELNQNVSDLKNDISVAQTAITATSKATNESIQEKINNLVNNYNSINQKIDEVMAKENTLNTKANEKTVKELANSLYSQVEETKSDLEDLILEAKIDIQIYTSDIVENAINTVNTNTTEVVNIAKDEVNENIDDLSNFVVDWYKECKDNYTKDKESLLEKWNALVPMFVDVANRGIETNNRTIQMQKDAEEFYEKYNQDIEKFNENYNNDKKSLTEKWNALVPVFVDVANRGIETNNRTIQMQKDAEEFYEKYNQDIEKFNENYNNDKKSLTEKWNALVPMFVDVANREIEINNKIDKMQKDAQDHYAKTDANYTNITELSDFVSEWHDEYTDDWNTLLPLFADIANRGIETNNKIDKMQKDAKSHYEKTDEISKNINDLTDFVGVSYKDFVDEYNQDKNNLIDTYNGLLEAFVDVANREIEINNRQKTMQKDDKTYYDALCGKVDKVQSGIDAFSTEIDNEVLTSVKGIKEKVDTIDTNVNTIKNTLSTGVELAKTSLKQVTTNLTNIENTSSQANTAIKNIEKLIGTSNEPASNTTVFGEFASIAGKIDTLTNKVDTIDGNVDKILDKVTAAYKLDASKKNDLFNLISEGVENKWNNYQFNYHILEWLKSDLNVAIQ